MLNLLLNTNSIKAGIAVGCCSVGVARDSRLADYVALDGTKGWLGREVGAAMDIMAAHYPPANRGHHSFEKGLEKRLRVANFCLSMSFGYGPAGDQQEMISLSRRRSAVPG